MSNRKDETYKIIANNVRKYRLSNNLSQEKLSEMIEANSKFVGHVERCERFISLKKLIELADIFNVPVKALLDE